MLDVDIGLGDYGSRYSWDVPKIEALNYIWLVAPDRSRWEVGDDRVKVSKALLDRYLRKEEETMSVRDEGVIKEAIRLVELGFKRNEIYVSINSQGYPEEVIFGYTRKELLQLYNAFSGKEKIERWKLFGNSARLLSGSPRYVESFEEDYAPYAIANSPSSLKELIECAGLGGVSCESLLEIVGMLYERSRVRMDIESEEQMELLRRIKIGELEEEVERIRSMGWGDLALSSELEDLGFVAMLATLGDDLEGKELCYVSNKYVHVTVPNYEEMDRILIFGEDVIGDVLSVDYWADGAKNALECVETILTKKVERVSRENERYVPKRTLKSPIVIEYSRPKIIERMYGIFKAIPESRYSQILECLGRVIVEEEKSDEIFNPYRVLEKVEAKLSDRRGINGSRRL